MHSLRSLAPLALALPIALGGCYRYDMRATNTSGEDLRVSLVKGKRQREISAVVLEPGASVGWKGQSQRPLVLRVANDPDVGTRTEVLVPRRVHTEFEVGFQGGEITIASDQPVVLREPAPEPVPESEAQPEEQWDSGYETEPTGDADTGDQGGADPAVDLVEPDDD